MRCCDIGKVLTKRNSIQHMTRNPAGDLILLERGKPHLPLVIALVKSWFWLWRRWSLDEHAAGNFLFSTCTYLHIGRFDDMFHSILLPEQQMSKRLGVEHWPIALVHVWGEHVAQQMKDRKSTEKYTNMSTSNPPQRCIVGLFWNWGATAVDNRNWDRSHSVWNILDATWCKKNGQEEMRQEVIPKRSRKRFRPLKTNAF